MTDPKDSAADAATVVPAGPRLPAPPPAGAMTFFDGTRVPAPRPVDGTILEGPHDAPPAPTTAVPSPAHPALALGVRYQPGEVLGAGGMGKVIAAVDPSLRREVAIKTLLDPGEAQVRQRFLEEAEVTGQLEHPNIVPVHELGHDPRSGPYLVMKRVRGRSLKDVLQLLAERKPGALARLAQGAAPSLDLGSIGAAPLPTGAAHVSAVVDTRPTDPGAPGTQTVDPALEATVAPGAKPAPRGGGPTLAQSLRFDSVPDAPEKALPWLLNLFGKVCEAVAYAHSRGVIHRDLKPENIMVGEFGEVLVMDWGLAKVVGRAVPEDDRRVAVRRPESGESAVHTMDGEILGTPMYMPPEQARGEIGALDERSDVYSMGAILYEILALERPFEGAHVYQVISRVIEGEFAPPRARSRAPWEVPRELEAVVLKAMARQRADRYPSVLALKEDVEAYFAGRRLTAAEYSAWDLLVKWVKRHGAAVATGLAAFIVLVVVVVVFVLSLARERAEAERQRDLAKQAAGEARDQALLAQRRVAEGLVLQGNALLVAERWDQSVNRYREAQAEFARLGLSAEPADCGLTNAYRKSPPALLEIRGWKSGPYGFAFTPDGRRLLYAGPNEPPAFFDAVTGRRLLTFDADPKGTGCTVLSHDGKLLYVASGDGVLHVMDAATGKVVRRMKIGDADNAPGFSLSPDGKSVVASDSGGMVRIWDEATGDLRKALRVFHWHIDSATLSPDGTRLLTSDHGGNIKLWDVATGQELHAMHQEGYVRSLFLPDGRRLISAAGDLRLWDAETGTLTWVARGHEGALTGAVVLPDGRRAATCSYDQTLRVFDLDAQREVLRLYGAQGRYGALALTPDGAKSASIDEHLVLRINDLARNSDRAPMRGHWGGVRRLAASADGRRVLSSGERDGTVRLWDLASGLPVRVFHGHAAGVWDVAMTRDGATAISGAADGTVRVWDVATGRQTNAWDAGIGMVTSIALSPDDRRLTTGGQVGAAKVWDWRTGRELGLLIVADPARPETKWVGGVNWSPDGRRILTCCADGSLRLWDAESFKMQVEVPAHPEMVVSARWSPDGKKIAVGTTDLSAALYDAADLHLLHKLIGPPAAVWDVAFTPDGSRVLTGDGNGNVWLWDVESGRELHRFGPPVGGVGGMIFLPGTRTALISFADGSIERLDLDAPAWYREFDRRVSDARAALDRAAEDPAALTTLGEWYAHRGAWDWAVVCFDRARAGGGAVPAELFAPCLRRVGRRDDADREYARFAEEKGKSDPQAALHAALCRAALKDDRAAAEFSAQILPQARALSPGRTDERLDEKSLLDDGRRVNLYSFTGYAGETIELHMKAEGFPPLITLRPPMSNGISAVPRDPGAPADLEVTLPDDGAYVLVCTSKDAGVTGTFTLEYKVR